MDRALKERIIGATVLVLFVVLVVPVFLDGPDNDAAVISQNVPLPGQSGNENQTIVLHRDRDRPEPVAKADTTVEEEPSPERPAAPVAAPTRSEPESNPEPEANPEPKVQQETTQETEPPPPDEVAETKTQTPDELTSTTGMWAVQLGSFGNQENAKKLSADLRKQNFTAFLSKLSTGDAELYRVRIGPQKDRESAEKVAEQLARAGYKGQVVPHP